MREIFFGSITIALCFMALNRPAVGMMGYIWYAVMRPDVLAWATHRSLSWVIALATLVGAFRYLPDLPATILRNRYLAMYVGLLLIMALSVAFSPYVAISWSMYKSFLPGAILICFIPVLLTTPDQIRLTVILIACSLGIYGAKTGAAIFLFGAFRIAHGPGGALSDNNNYALALAMVVPILWYARELVDKSWQKLLLMVSALLTMPAVLATQSRGGMLTLGAVVLFIVWRSRHRLAAGLVVALAAIPISAMFSVVVSNRLSTLKDVSQDASASSRLEAAKAALRIGMEYPVLGVGFGGYPFAQISGKGLVVHNNYLEMLVDHGLPSLLLFLLLMFGLIRALGRSHRELRAQNYKMSVVPLALQSSLVAFSVGSTFLSRTNWDVVYILLMTGAAWLGVKHLVPVDEQHLGRGVAVPARPNRQAPWLPQPVGLRPAPPETAPPQVVGPLRRWKTTE